MFRFLGWIAATVATSFALTGCPSDSSTGVLVQITIDHAISFPDDADELQLLANSDGYRLGPQGILSWSTERDTLRHKGEFGIAPGGSESAPIQIFATLLLNGAKKRSVATKAVTTTFVPGKIVKVPLHFEASCLGKLCCNAAPPDGSGLETGDCFTDPTPDCRVEDGAAVCLPAEECRKDSDCESGTCNPNRLCAGGDAGNDSGEDAATD